MRLLVIGGAGSSAGTCGGRPRRPASLWSPLAGSGCLAHPCTGRSTWPPTTPASIAEMIASVATRRGRQLRRRDRRRPGRAGPGERHRHVRAGPGDAAGRNPGQARAPRLCCGVRARRAGRSRNRVRPAPPGRGVRRHEAGRHPAGRAGPGVRAGRRGAARVQPGRRRRNPAAACPGAWPPSCAGPWPTAPTCGWARWTRSGTSSTRATSPPRCSPPRRPRRCRTRC